MTNDLDINNSLVQEHFTNDLHKCVKMKLLIDSCSMQRLKNAQVSIYSLADLNKGHCVEVTFFEGKLGGFFCGKGLKILLFSSELNLLSLSKCNKFQKLNFQKVNIRNLPNLPSRKISSTQWLNLYAGRQFFSLIKSVKVL